MTRRIHRLHRTPVLLMALATFASMPRRAAAQQQDSDTPARWALQVATGAMMPIGSMHDALRSAPLTAAQLAWRPLPRVAVIGTLGWARSRDLIAAGTPKVDAITADVGAEWRGKAHDMARWGSVASFVGGGVGMRRYDSRALNTAASHHLTTYAALGTDLTVKRVGLRVEVRDYVGGFSPIGGAGRRSIANDVVVMTALRFVRRPATTR
ncbi:hypothetical protein [Gemmatimonas sp.]